MKPTEGYASNVSVSPGQDLALHLRTDLAPIFWIEVVRRGKTDELVRSDWGYVSAHAPAPLDASTSGCHWPVAYTLTIPDNWNSGLYVVQVYGFDPLNGTTLREIPFIVRPANPGTLTKILYHFAMATCQAYNPWPSESEPGESLYGTDYKGDDQVKVSFNRPFADTFASHFSTWDSPFITWLEDTGVRVDYCTSVDLHANPHLLDNYHLLLSVGHDEYWSKGMRDHVEAFIANGGNVAFFSGNVCWWQVRYEDNYRTLVCYRDNHQGNNPQVDDPQSGTKLATVRWRESPVDRPENEMTGVSFYNGAMGEYDRNDRSAFGYKVRFAEHWLFDRTGLKNDDTFGKDRKIIGNETDAALFEEHDGLPRITGSRPWVTGLDGTPLNFVVLAEADLPGWKLPADVRTDDYSPKATMGLYRNHGTVFTAATTDWPWGLIGPWTAVHEITLNVLRRLSCACGLDGAAVQGKSGRDGHDDGKERRAATARRQAPGTRSTCRPA